MRKKFDFSVKKLCDIGINTTFDFHISNAVTLDNLQNNSICFCKELNAYRLSLLSKLNECLIILPQQFDKELKEEVTRLENNNIVVYSKNPRLDFAMILGFIFDYKNISEGNNCVLGHNVKIGHNVKLGYNVVIGDNVVIGNNCIIMDGAIIKDNVILSDDVIVRENAVIGGWGFGFERDENNIPVRLPHIGGVVIAQNVEIGALTSVAAGTMSPTFIDKNTKIDDRAIIAHNCHIGKNCIITGNVSICGSVKVGNNVWIGPNSAIMDGLSIADGTIVGIGSIVKRNIKDTSVVTGNPAVKIEKYAQDRIEYLTIRKKVLSEE